MVVMKLLLYMVKHYIYIYSSDSNSFSKTLYLAKIHQVFIRKAI